MAKTCTKYNNLYHNRHHVRLTHNKLFRPPKTTKKSVRCITYIVFYTIDSKTCMKTHLLALLPNLPVFSKTIVECYDFLNKQCPD